MSGTQRQYAEYMHIRGRDGSTTGLVGIAENKALECLNVDFYRTSLARKRGGSDLIGMTFSSGGPFASSIQSVLRHMPGADETAAELWAVDANGLFGRLAGSTQWTAPTLKDALTNSANDVVGCPFNGKFVLAYKSNGVDRLHVWDGSTVRRVGLAAPAAPTVANTGAGAYAATIRYYKQAYTVQSGGVTLRRSELSSSVSFTPSGAGTAARITKAAAISEGETHWELYASADNANFYLIATTVVGTTTVDDSAAPSSYSTNTAAPLVGTNTVPTSVRYVITDGNRLIMAGSRESGGKNNRVWFSAVLGASGVGDDERIPQTTELSYYIDLDENDGGYITGIAGPFLGIIWVFKNRQIWKLSPTGDDVRPYRARAESKGISGIGCVRHQSIVMGEDEYGSPALYFMSDRGPYRITAGNGIQFLGYDIQDVWASVNRESSLGVAHGVYHADLRQVWWWVSTSANVGDAPDVRLVFDTRLGRFDAESGGVRGGWAKHTNGAAIAAFSSTMFANTIGASMSRDLKPYIGSASASNRIYKCDTTSTDDNGTAFQAYMTFPDRHFGGVHRQCWIGNPILVGSAGSHTLTVTMSRDYGEESRTSNTTMAATGSATRVVKVCEAGFTADAKAVGLTVGDSAAVSNSWTLDAVRVPYEPRQEVAA